MSTKGVGADVAQHFLLSTAARSLSLARVARMSDAEAAETFKQIRWHASGGEPVCLRCGCLGVYAFKTRALFKCKASESGRRSRQFGRTGRERTARRRISATAATRYDRLARTPASLSPP
jgi:hypothetical protein